jgi:hypothetical protein
MATILQLAEHADLPVETVLRVVNGEPTSTDAQERVARAIEALGPPSYPRFAPTSTELVPHERTVLDAVDGTLPAEFGSVVYEAVRIEVRPVGEHVAQLKSLLAEIVDRLGDERRERIEDLGLMTELLIEGWKGVDRRLGRIEKVLARLEQAQSTADTPQDAPQRVVRMDDFPRADRASYWG